MSKYECSASRHCIGMTLNDRKHMSICTFWAVMSIVGIIEKLKITTFCSAQKLNQKHELNSQIYEILQKIRNTSTY